MTQAANEPWVWVPLALILAVHDEQLTDHGGLQGVRDEGLLVSALARAQHLASYGAPDVAQLAAAPPAAAATQAGETRNRSQRVSCLAP